MNSIKNNIAISDFIFSLKNIYSWTYLAYFDLKLKYRRAFLGPWWIVLGMAISAGLMCLLWSTIFNLDWKSYLTYLFSGFIIWMWISGQVIEAPQIFYTDASRFMKSYANPPIFYVFRKCYINLLLFLHHIPLIIIVTVLVNGRIDYTAFLSLPLGLFIVFINFIFFTSILGMLGARYRDIEPTVKSLMPPMLLLTPILWKPEMLGEYASLIYWNPFVYFVGIVRDDLIGLPFDIYIWIGALVITFVQMLIFLILYSKKRDRVVFWI